MALNPNAFVDGVMDGFLLHIEPPSYEGRNQPQSWLHDLDDTHASGPLNNSLGPQLDLWFQLKDLSIDEMVGA